MIRTFATTPFLNTTIAKHATLSSMFTSLGNVLELKLISFMNEQIEIVLK